MDKNIENRYSCKSYLQIPVEWEKIIEILKAGSLAPSSGNLQNWKFILIQDKKNRAQVADACVFQTWMNEAPAYIVICGNVSSAQRYYFEKAEMFTLQNTSAAIQNMLIEATNQDLGSNWVGAFDEEKLNEILKIDSKWKIHAIITLGYINEKDKRPFKYQLKDIVHFEEFGNNKYSPSLFPLSNIKEHYRQQKEKVEGEIKGTLQKLSKDKDKELETQEN